MLIVGEKLLKLILVRVEKYRRVSVLLGPLFVKPLLSGLVKNQVKDGTG